MSQDPCFCIDYETCKTLARVPLIKEVIASQFDVSVDELVEDPTRLILTLTEILEALTPALRQWIMLRQGTGMYDVMYKDT